MPAKMTPNTPVHVYSDEPKKRAINRLATSSIVMIPAPVRNTVAFNQKVRWDLLMAGKVAKPERKCLSQSARETNSRFNYELFEYREWILGESFEIRR